MNSAGSAAEEQKKYQESIQYSIEQTKARLEELSQDFLSSNLIKGTVNTGGGLIGFLDFAIKKGNELKMTLPSIIGLISSISISKLGEGSLD